MVATFIASAAGFAHAQNPPAPATEEAAPGVVLEADQVNSNQQEGTITAEGHVEARYEGRTLRAEKLIYDTNRHTVHAEGHVQILDEDGSVRFADEIEVDNQLNAGVATNFSMRIPGGGVAAAASAVRLPSGINELNHVVYTACPICTDGREPSWTMRARKATQNPNTDRIAYRDVVIEMHGVPVFYMPYFSHPDPSAGRKSGFLMPSFGQTQRLGAFYQQPYYLAISNYSDLTIAPRFMSNVNPLLLLQYRKRFWSGDLHIEGGAGYDKDFDNSGNRFGEASARSHLFATGAFRIDDYWNWDFGAARVSDDLYLKRYNIASSDANQSGLYLSDLTRLFSHVALTGQDENSYTNVSFMSIQGLRAGDSEANIPLVLPVGEYQHSFRDPLLDGRFNLKLSTANIVRNTGVNSSRITAGGDWDVERIVGPGLMLTPFAQGRQDLYRIDNYTTSDPIYVSRGLGIAGAEVRWPFVHASKSASYMVEPIVMAAMGSNGGNDSRIPNEDSLSFELDDSGLFRPSGVPNYDLWEPGARVSAGVRASAVSGPNNATAEFGRRWRSEDTPAFTTLSNLRNRDSDWGGSLNASVPHASGAVRVRLDDKTFKVNRIDTSLGGNVGPVSGSMRYFDVDSSTGAVPSQEIAGSVGVRLAKHWSTSYGLRRDLNSDITLSHDVAVTYNDDCTFIQFSFTRSETLDRTVGPSEGFQIRIGLSTLGVFGGGSSDLQRWR